MAHIKIRRLRGKLEFLIQLDPIPVEIVDPSVFATLPGDATLVDFNASSCEPVQDLVKIAYPQIDGQAPLLGRRQTSVSLVDRKHGVLPDLARYRISGLEDDVERAAFRVLTEIDAELALVPAGQRRRIVAVKENPADSLNRARRFVCHFSLPASRQSLPLFTVNQ